MEYVNGFRKFFWSESFWLPENVTWELIEKNERKIQYANFNDLYYSIITAAVLLIIRFTLERYIFTPVAKYFGIKSGKRKKASKNEILEDALIKYKRKIEYKQIQGLAKQLDWSERKVERWLRIKFSENKPTTLTKFTESAWRCSFYTFAFIYGLCTLWNKPWMWDSIHCYVDYPHHNLTSDVWFYYNFELGFYLSLIISQFFDIQRKDFWQMFIHHIITVILLSFSWAGNLHRTGTLVLIIHDFADIPLEGAKLSRYIRSPTASNIIFSIFTLCWIYSRIGLLPYRVIAYSSYHALFILPMFPAYYFFNSLLIALQILHILWTWLIVKIAYNAIFNDGVKDLRESDDTTVDELSESEESKTTTPIHKPFTNGYIDGLRERQTIINNSNNHKLSVNGNNNNEAH